MEPAMRGRVVLFQSDEDEEQLCITCEVSEGGDLIFRQESSGDLTAWCFEESPHEVTACVFANELMGLLDYYHVDEIPQLVRALSAAYCGYDALIRIRKLLRRLGVGYEVIERSIVR